MANHGKPEPSANPIVPKVYADTPAAVRSSIWLGRPGSVPSGGSVEKSGTVPSGATLAPWMLR